MLFPWYGISPTIVISVIRCVFLPVKKCLTLHTVLVVYLQFLDVRVWNLGLGVHFDMYNLWILDMFIFFIFFFMQGVPGVAGRPGLGGDCGFPGQPVSWYFKKKDYKFFTRSKAENSI